MNDKAIPSCIDVTVKNKNNVRKYRTHSEYKKPCFAFSACKVHVINYKSFRINIYKANRKKQKNVERTPMSRYLLFR